MTDEEIDKIAKRVLELQKEQGVKTILTKESYMANCYKVGGEDE